MGDRARDQPREEENRLQQHDQHTDRASYETHQGRRVDGSDGLRNDLRDHQHEDGQDPGKDAHPGVTEDHGRLGTRDCRTDGVSDGVERQDGADRVVDVLLLESEQDLCADVTFVAPRGEARDAAAEQRRLQDRAQKRDRQSDEDREQQRRQTIQAGSRGDRKIEG